LRAELAATRREAQGARGARHAANRLLAFAAVWLFAGGIAGLRRCWWGTVPSFCPHENSSSSRLRSSANGSVKPPFAARVALSDVRAHGSESKNLLRQLPVLARQGWLWVRLLALAALVASAVLTADYVNDVATYCAENSGCAAVRQSGFGYLAVSGVKVPLPSLGLIGFALLFAGTLINNAEKRRRFVIPVAVLGGVVGLALIAVQAFVIHRFCVWCLVADFSAVLAAGVVLGLYFSQDSVQLESSFRGVRLAPWALSLLAITLSVVPLAWPKVKLQPPVPPEIAALYVPGKVTIVEFVDFECPHCRHLHEVLAPLVKQAGGKIVVVRRPIALAQHPHAKFAALSALCVEDSAAETFADFLFTTEDLSAAAIKARAVSLGMNAATFDACVNGKPASAKLEAARELFDKAKLQGLPSTYIGAWQNSGVASLELYEDAIRRAELGEGSRGLSLAEFSGISILWLFGIVFLGRRTAALGPGAR